MSKCTAIADGDRIDLIVKKEDKGYNHFSKVLRKIKEKGCLSWYGDVTEENGKEQCGLIITAQPVEKQ